MLYKHLGCFNDKSERALTEKLGERMRSVEECYQLAKDKGYQAFGLQGGHECWSSSDALQNYGKYGAGGTKCSTKGLGGHWALDVYMILGTFRRNSGAGSSGVSFPLTIQICPLVLYNSLGKVEHSS